MMARFTPRERFLVLVALPVILVIAGKFFVWDPMVVARGQAKADIAAYLQIQTLAAQSVSTPKTAIIPVDRAPLANRLTQSAAALGLSLRRLEPEGPRMRVFVDDAPFETILRWIDVLEGGQGVLLVNLEIERRIEPGVVSARLSVEDAS